MACVGCGNEVNVAQTLRKTLTVIKTSLLHGSLLCAALIAPCAALAGVVDLVQNGDFETTSMYTNGAFTPEQMNASNVAGWSTGGYNFIFGANTASTVGSTGQYGALTLWDGSQVPGGAVLGQSPTGGNFVGADGAFQVGAITQTLGGLTKGSNYAVSFDWAGAQQYGYTGATTERWLVSLGGQTQSTATVNDASHGFSGWMHQTFIFQANATSEVLSFLAVGTPNGEPPFSLLDGVSAVDVPEPASLGLMAAALAVGGLVFALRRRAV